MMKIEAGSMLFNVPADRHDKRMPEPTVRSYPGGGRSACSRHVDHARQLCVGPAAAG
jgi:hypothetical protein